MSILQDAETLCSKFLRNHITGLVWFNSFHSWNPEGRQRSSLQFCAWCFLVVKCPSGNKSHESSVSPEATAECQDRMFLYWDPYQPPGMHLGLFGCQGRDDPKYMYKIMRKTPRVIPGSFPEETGEMRQNVLNKCRALEMQSQTQQEAFSA